MKHKIDIQVNLNSLK